MNILVVTECIRQDREGGDCTFVSELCATWAAAGHNVHVLTRRIHADQSRNEEVDGFHVTRFPAPSLGSKFYFFYPFFSAIAAVMFYKQSAKDFHPDIVHFHHPYSAFLITAFRNLGINRNATFCFTFHSPKAAEYAIMYQHCPIVKFLLVAYARVVERFVLRRQEVVFCLSKYMKEQMEKHHGKVQARVEIIPGGVDIDRFVPTISKEEVRRKVGLSAKGRVLLTVRRLVSRMGLENLIDAMKYVVDKYPDVRLLIIGNGPLRESLKTRIRGLDLTDHVSLLGYVADEILPNYYQASDLFVLPTAELEGYGLVILEAFSSGLPVVGAPVGAIPAVISGFDDDLLARGTGPVDIAEKILGILSEDKLEERGTRYREKVLACFGWASVAKRYIDVFSNRK